MLVVVLVAPAGTDPVGAVPPGPRPVVYLTIDDGPSMDRATGDMLAVLAEYDVQATFFVVGERVEQEPAMMRRILADGHALGNHTQSHPDLTELSAPVIRSELASAQASVTAAGGPALSCFRPPFGATNAIVRSVAAETGMTEELWSLDIHDWVPSRTVADYLRDLDEVRGGDVVLVHDGFVGQAETVQAVDAFLADNATRFEFRALPSCTNGPLPHQRPTPSVLVPRPMQAVAADLGSTPQFRIQRLYRSVFARPADRAGLAFWIRFERERGFGNVVRAFEASPEFAANYASVPTDAFLQSLYRNSLGRRSDAAGVEYWKGRLAGGLSRTSVIRHFAESPELLASAPRTALSPETVLVIDALSSNGLPGTSGYQLWSVQSAQGADAEMAEALRLLGIAVSDHGGVIVSVSVMQGRDAAAMHAALVRYDRNVAEGRSPAGSLVDALSSLA